MVYQNSKLFFCANQFNQSSFFVNSDRYCLISIWLCAVLHSDIVL